MQDSHTIRKISLEDAALLSEWFNKFVDQDAGVVENFHVDEEQEKIYIKDILSKEEDKITFSRIILREGRLVGKADLIPLRRYIDKHVAEISFGLLKNEREAGTVLLQEIERIAIQEGYEQLLYFILSNNTYFINIFTSIGFQEVGRIKKFYKKAGKHYDRVVLQKEIIKS